MSPPGPRLCPRAPPSPLPDELIEEILVRVAPDDPASLVRAALACRRWWNLVADQAFRRRRLALHGGAPPMLGFLCHGGEQQQPLVARFVSTSSCRLPRADAGGGDHAGDDLMLLPSDARHGRVLLHDRDYRELVVWDPITDHRVVLPRRPEFLGDVHMNAAVLCAAAATGACDHLDCRRGGPFVVVIVGTNEVLVDDNADDFMEEFCPWMWFGPRSKNMFSCFYSSETGAWSDPTFADHPGDNVDQGRSALVGNALFFTLSAYDRIIKYDLGTREMSVVRLPYVRNITNTDFRDFASVELTTLEDGRLGFARVEESIQLWLWSSDVDEGGEVTGWTPQKVIDLRSLFPVANLFDLKHCLVGFVESVCIAFVAVQGQLFTTDIKSGLMKEVSEGHCNCVVPYIDFCTPALRALSRDDGPSKDVDGAPMGGIHGSPLV